MELILSLIIFWIMVIFCVKTVLFVISCYEFTNPSNNILLKFDMFLCQYNKEPNKWYTGTTFISYYHENEDYKIGFTNIFEYGKYAKWIRRKKKENSNLKLKKLIEIWEEQ